MNELKNFVYLLCKKMDGDLKKIRMIGQYMIEIWKAIGMNMQNVQFLWASDEVSHYSLFKLK